MSEIDSTELAQVLVGATLIVAALRGTLKAIVNYALPGWMITVLIFGLIIGYYQRKE